MYYVVCELVEQVAAVFVTVKSIKNNQKYILLKPCAMQLVNQETKGNLIK